MNVRSPPVLRPDEFSDVDARLLELITRGFRDLSDAVQQSPAHEVSSGVFTSAASGVTTVSIKNPLATKPRHVTVALRRDDLADFSAAWSWWFVMAGEQVQVRFIGLPASTKHAYSVELT